MGEVYRGYGEGRGGAYLRWDSEGVRNKDMLALPRPAFGIVGREELELVSSIRPIIFEKIDPTCPLPSDYAPGRSSV